MAQITESLVLEFESNLDAGRHINSTMGEERQLIEAWKSWHRRAELTSEPVAWMSANQKSFVHNLDIGDSVPNWTDYYTIPLYAAPQPCSRCAESELDMVLAEQARKIGNYFGRKYLVAWSDHSLADQLTDKLAALEAENKRQALVIEECREALESPPARMIHKAPEALAAIKAEKMFYEGEQGNKLLK